MSLTMDFISYLVGIFFTSWNYGGQGLCPDLGTETVYTLVCEYPLAVAIPMGNVPSGIMSYATL
jgi:hypothetical protein